MAKQERLAQAFIFVVQRQGDQRVLFGHFRSVGDPVNRTRRCVNKAFDAGCLGCHDHRLERIHVDRRAQFFVEFETGVVGNARQVDDRVGPLEHAREDRRVPNIAVYDTNALIVLGQVPGAKV